MRRVYLPQYSAEPLTNVQGTKLFNHAEPFPGTFAVRPSIPRGKPYTV